MVILPFTATDNPLMETPERVAAALAGRDESGTSLPDDFIFFNEATRLLASSAEIF
jgi:hypothetical protein